jgi:hypothetical protein
MKRLIGVVLLSAGCGPMFDSPMAPEPVAWNVTGSNARMCLKLTEDRKGFEPVTLSGAPYPVAPCPPGWAVPQ